VNQTQTCYLVPEPGFKNRPACSAVCVQIQLLAGPVFTHWAGAQRNCSRSAAVSRHDSIPYDKKLIAGSGRPVARTYGVRGVSVIFKTPLPVSIVY
jgi:hypothetical protein